MSAYAVSARGLAGRKVPQGVLMGDMLFAASEPGAWYDPSDMSTLFQDSAGTTPVTAVEKPVGRILDKSGRGNHATQVTTTKRPVYSRRVNAFNTTQAAINGTVTVIPDAFGPGFDGLKLTRTATGDEVYFALNPSYVRGGSTYTLKVHLKKGGNQAATQVVSFYTNVGYINASVNWASGAISYGAMSGGFTITNSSSVQLSADSYYVTLGYAVPAGATLVTLARVYFWAGALGVPGLIIGNPQFTLATDAHLPYQRVNTATDYDADPAKFPAYRRLDGVDDSHASATGGGGNAGFFFSQAITVLGSAGTARTLFSDAGTNTGYIVRLNASNQLELSAGDGTAYTTIATAGTLAVGSTDIVQAWDDGTNLSVKIGNGPTASVARPVVVAGTAGYTLYQDNGASTGYFSGRSYGEIYRKDSGLTQVQREAVAVYQRQKARIA